MDYLNEMLEADGPGLLEEVNRLLVGIWINNDNRWSISLAKDRTYVITDIAHEIDYTGTWISVSPEGVPHFGTILLSDDRYDSGSTLGFHIEDQDVLTLVGDNARKQFTRKMAK